MYLQQFYLSCLAHASYMLGSEGVAAVVDPQRDLAIYLDAARRRMHQGPIGAPTWPILNLHHPKKGEESWQTR